MLPFGNVVCYVVYISFYDSLIAIYRQAKHIYNSQKKNHDRLEL